MSLLLERQAELIQDVSEIRYKMLRAAADLRQLAAQKPDPTKAATMRQLADRLEMLANEG